MKDRWYGDNRDLVKWGALIYLAREYEIKEILHIALYREERAMTLKCGQRDVPIPREVLEHFPRNISHIETLSKQAKVNIKVFKEPFCKRRHEYFHKVCQMVAEFGSPKIAFLDPDTGIARAKAELEHVRPDEVSKVHSCLKAGDLLALYQHARQGRRQWREETRSEFASAVHAYATEIEVITCDEVARDAALLAVKVKL